MIQDVSNRVQEVSNPWFCSIVSKTATAFLTRDPSDGSRSWCRYLSLCVGVAVRAPLVGRRDCRSEVLLYYNGIEQFGQQLPVALVVLSLTQYSC